MPVTEERPLSADELAQLTRALDYLGLLASFPWHVQQQFALAAATNTVVVLGGNRSGKSQAGLGIVSRLVRREGPIYRRLKDPQNRPLKIWVSPQTLEKYLSVWEPRLIGQVFAGMDYQYVQSPHHRFTWDDPCAKGNTLWGKSQEQGFMAFESDEVDLIILDEEPADKRIYTSCEQRLATTNGVIVFTFTPLLGMSWTHGTFYVPVVKPQYQVRDRDGNAIDRVWKRGNALTLIQMGMADNPAAVAGGGVARLRENPAITEAEKQTRLFGKYGYAEGLIFPQFADLMVEA